MRRVTTIYHWEPEGYWAESPDAPGFSAAAATLAELREQVRDGLAFHFGQPADIVEIFPDVMAPVWSLSASSGVVDARSSLLARIVTAGTQVTGVLVGGTRNLTFSIGRLAGRV